MRGTEATPPGIFPGRWRGAPPTLGRRTQKCKEGPGPQEPLLAPPSLSALQAGSSVLDTLEATPASLCGLRLSVERTAGLCKHCYSRNRSEQALQLRLGKSELDRAGRSGQNPRVRLISIATRNSPDVPWLCLLMEKQGTCVTEIPTAKMTHPKIAHFHVTSVSHGSCPSVLTAQPTNSM